MYNMFRDSLIIPEYQDEFDALKTVWHDGNGQIAFRTLHESRIITKCNMKAVLLKQKGDACFKDQNYDSAFKNYFYALLTAEYNSEFYGRILEKLSEDQYKMDLWVSCIHYVDMCMKSAYPRQSYPKLFIRKIRSLRKMGQSILAEQTALDYKSFIENSKIAENRKEMYFELAKNALKENTVLETYLEETFVKPHMKENPNMCGVSIKAKLRTNKEYGRHIVAHESIEKGECILIEKPYAVSSLARCADCFIYIEKTIVPCTDCTKIVYCSEACRESDLKVHKWECKLFQKECMNDINIKVRFAYRIFLKGMLDGFPVDLGDDLCLNGKSSKFANYCKLHVDDINNGMTDLLTRDVCLIIAYLYGNDDFFTWVEEKKLFENNLLIVGKHILKLALIANLNAFQNVNITEENIHIYLSLSFFNHSCVPNTIQCITNNGVFLKASENIKAGQQIYIDYLRQNKSLERKNLILSKWNFNCNCTKCCGVDSPEDMIKCPKCDSFAAIIDHFLKCKYCKHSAYFSSRNERILNKIYDLVNKDTVGLVHIEVLHKVKILAEKIKLNPRWELIQCVYYEIIIRELKSGYFRNVDECLPVLRNMENIHDDRAYMKIFLCIKFFTKPLYLSKDPLSSHMKSTVNSVLDYLDFLEEYYNMYHPIKQVLDDMVNIRKSFITQRDRII